MRRSGAIVIAVGALGFLSLTVTAGAQPRLQKDETVVLKIPMSVLKMGKHRSGWAWGPLPHLEAIVEAGPQGVTVNGDPNWQSSGFPSLLELKVKKIKVDKNDDRLAEIELQKGSRPHGPEIRLLFKTDVKSAFPKVVATPAEVEGYRKEAYGALASRFFTGPLARLSSEQKETLLRFADITARGTTISSTLYKDNLYLAIDLGDGDTVYNDLKLNQGQRIARVMNDQMLTILKAFAQAVADVKEIYGLKLEFVIPHKSFAEESAKPQEDKLELYVPAELIKKFANADITSQQLMDGSVVIVNANRVQISLSE